MLIKIFLSFISDIYKKIIYRTSLVINYKVLAEIHPEFGEECYVSKDVFIKYINSLIP